MPEAATVIIPAIKALHEFGSSDITTNTIKIEILPLYLPSSLSTELCSISTIKKVADSELRLQIAQAKDALADVQHQRRIISTLKEFKRLNTSGTGNKSNTHV
ncbi:hypothetical protein BDQ17DRAFT_1433798 [Cyathus striatus]|nr:hypothetical protein BDQ17DRAFT_1433798 [Cyathus striatus]